MQVSAATLIFFGLLAACANLAGGLLVLPVGGALKRREVLLKFLVGAGAGFLLAVIFIEILPRTIELWQIGQTTVEGRNEVLIFPMLLLLGGYLLINFFEQTLIPHLHLESHSKALIPATSAFSAIGGLLFHAFFDGLALASTISVDFGAGLLVFLAVFLHKLPEGFTAVSLVLASGGTTRKGVAASAVVGATTLLGVLAFAVLKNQIDFSVAYVLPIAAGVALYVAASELIPELYHHGERNRLISVFVFAGVALFFLLHYLLHALLEV
jgi:zinc transporter ZupT